MARPLRTHRRRSKYPALAELIRTRRLQLGLSQEFVADKVGIDQSTLSCWERGTRTPSGPGLLRLQSYLRFTDSEIEAVTKKPA